MFGITLPELLIIMVVALVVIGPEQLPKVARTMGMLWARAHRYINSVKSDISRDMAIEEFRQMQQKVQQEASNAEQAMKQATQSAAQSVDQQMRELNSAVSQPVPQPPAEQKKIVSER